MKFKGHLIAGTIASLTAGVLANTFFNITTEMQVQIIGLVFVFSLLPDLDTNSIPRKWFYRIIFAVLFYLAITKQFETATIIALISLTPLLSHHRSWTHSIWSALFVPAILILIYSFFSSPLPYNKFFMIQNIKFIIYSNIWIICSCTIGWLTHLYVDFKKF